MKFAVARYMGCGKGEVLGSIGKIVEFSCAVFCENSNFSAVIREFDWILKFLFVKGKPFFLAATFA